MKQGIKLILLVLLALTMSTIQARAIYKWVDEDGTVHYGEKPQHKGAKEIRIRDRGGVEKVQRASSSENSGKQRDKILKAMEAERLERDEKREKIKKKQKQQKKKCARAKDRLRSYKESGSIYRLDENGKRVYMPDSYRTQRINKMQSDVNKWCK